MNKPYKVIMSRGDEIRIDADELPLIIQAVKNKSVAVLRSGMFNPSFFVSVVRDEERWKSFLDDIKYQENELALKAEGPKQLKDIFDGVRSKLLGSGK